MGMNQTPASERVHVSFFGKRNAGKSSIINAVTGQDLAIVSSVMGTTTDPVYKTMELLPLGPVMVIDTPGIDDEGELGALRVHKSYQVLNKTDIAILVIDSTAGKGEEELELIHRFHKKGIPYLIVYNKIDLLSTEKIKDLAMSVRAGEVLVSASDGMNIQELKEKIASLKPEDTHKYPLIQDLIDPLDLVILVVPIDKAAPKRQSDSATAADNPRYSGTWCSLSCCTRYRIKKYPGSFSCTRCLSETCRYRQSGICTCFKSCAGKHHPDFFFDSFFKI